MRLQRVRQELLSHRLWLRSHINGRNANAARTFAYSLPSQRAGDHNAGRSKVRQGKETKTSIPNARKGHWERLIKANDRKQTIAGEDVALLETALREPGRMGTAIAEYMNIQDKHIIPKDVLVLFTQSLFVRLRVERAKPTDDREQEVIERLHQVVGELVEQVKRGVFPAIPKCINNMIKFYAEGENVEAVLDFWKWLEKQEPITNYVSENTYAAIITTLAEQNAPLSEIEHLYKQALATFTSSFMEYHFSPNALVPDKSQEINFTPSSRLLEAIMYARVLRNDTKNAYLDLDTALRLWPSQTHRNLFKPMMNERGVTEAYAVFAIACRAGSPLSSSQFSGLVARLRKSMGASASSEQMIASLRAMLAATYMHVGAGGILTKNSITELIISITQLMRLDVVLALGTEEKRKLAGQVQEAVRKVIACSTRFKAQPGLSAFNSIITNLGGFGHNKDVIDMAMADIERLGMTPNVVTRRSILTAAGVLKDEDLIRDTWRLLVLAIAEKGQLPSSTDAYILVKACNNAELSELARTAIGEMEHLGQVEVDRLVEHMNEPKWEAGPASVPEVAQSYDHLAQGLGKIMADVEIFDARSADSVDVQDFSSLLLPLMLTPPPGDVALPASDMRNLYDKVTTDPSTASSTPSSDPESEQEVPMSKTGFSLATLRYENWKSLTYLLAQADKVDRSYGELVDKAIAAGERPPARHATPQFAKGWGVGLSDPIAEQDGAVAEVDVEAAIRKIKELRGLNVVVG